MEFKKILAGMSALAISSTVAVAAFADLSETTNFNSSSSSNIDVDSSATNYTKVNVSKANINAGDHLTITVNAINPNASTKLTINDEVIAKNADGKYSFVVTDTITDLNLIAENGVISKITKTEPTQEIVTVPFSSATKQVTSKSKGTIPTGNLTEGAKIAVELKNVSTDETKPVSVKVAGKTVTVDESGKYEYTLTADDTKNETIAVEAVNAELSKVKSTYTTIVYGTPVEKKVINGDFDKGTDVAGDKIIIEVADASTDIATPVTVKINGHDAVLNTESGNYEYVYQENDANNDVITVTVSNATMKKVAVAKASEKSNEETPTITFDKEDEEIPGKFIVKADDVELNDELVIYVQNDEGKTATIKNGQSTLTIENNIAKFNVSEKADITFDITNGTIEKIEKALATKEVDVPFVEVNDTEDDVSSSESSTDDSSNSNVDPSYDDNSSTGTDNDSSTDDSSNTDVTPKPTVVKVGKVNKVIASSTSKSVKIRWSAVSGAKGYKIYKLVGKTYKPVKTVSSKTRTLTMKSGIKPGTKYTYMVKAYKYISSKKAVFGAGGKVSIYTTPAAVTSLSAKNTGKGKVTVAFKKSSTKGTSYKIYYSSSKKSLGKAFKVVKYNSKNKTKTVKVAKTKLRKGKVYYFTVKSYKKIGSKYYTTLSSKKAVKIRK